MLVIETSRQFIRNFAINDADAMEAVFCDPEVLRTAEYGC
jgi:hypothetical protein